MKDMKEIEEDSKIELEEEYENIILLSTDRRKLIVIHLYEFIQVGNWSQKFTIFEHKWIFRQFT